MLVMKFGGTSVRDASAMESVIKIIVSHASSEMGTVVVLSATSGTTSQLLELARSAAQSNSVAEQVRQIAERHTQILTALSPNANTDSITELCDKLHEYLNALSILGECSDESLDSVASFGELLSTTVLYEALQAREISSVFVPATALIQTNDTFQQAAVRGTETTQHCILVLENQLHRGSIVITQGFIGSTADGRVTTLGRGGSDYSAALIGSALGAREIQIWTDVSGVYSADPRIIRDATPLETMSFDEMRTLAQYGAKVLHPDTILPAIEAGIPVRVLNTFEPDAAGTTITHTAGAEASMHAVTLVRPCVRIFCAGKGHDLTHLQSVLSKSLLSSHITRSGGTFIVHVPTNEERLCVDVALVGMDSAVEDVGLIVITGPRAQEPEIVSRITETLAENSATIVTASMQPRCVMASVPLDACLGACEAVHQLIRRRR